MKIKDYMEMDKSFAKVLRKTHNKVIPGILFWCSLFEMLMIAVSSAYGSDGDVINSFMYGIMVFFMLNMYHSCESRVIEYKKEANVFDKLMYIPFDMEKMFLAKVINIVKVNALYMIIAQATVFFWRAGFFALVKLLLSENISARGEIMLSVSGYFSPAWRIFQPAWVVVLVTMINVLTVYIDYRKSGAGLKHSTNNVFLVDNININLLITALVNIGLLTVMTASMVVENIIARAVVMTVLGIVLILFNIKMSRKLKLSQSDKVKAVMLIVAVLVGLLIGAYLILKNIVLQMI